MAVMSPAELRPIALGMLCDALLDDAARARCLARLMDVINRRVPPEARLDVDGLTARFVVGGHRACAPIAPDAPPWETFAWCVFEAVVERAPRADGPHLGPVFGGLDPDAISDDAAHELVHWVSSYEYCGRPTDELRRVIGLTLFDTQRTYDAPSLSWPRAWRGVSPNAPALTARLHKQGRLVLSWPDGEVVDLLSRWAPPPTHVPHAVIARELVRWIMDPLS
jgi:hypothetical protein